LGSSALILGVLGDLTLLHQSDSFFLVQLVPQGLLVMLEESRQVLIHHGPDLSKITRHLEVSVEKRFCLCH
jgi:hypothetical protein